MWHLCCRERRFVSLPVWQPAGQGVRVEGSSPSLFVRTDEVRQLRRGDTLTIGEENFWVDRVSPDDGGSCHLWLGRGVPPAVNRRR
ncbi:phage tail protein [Escherichia coli]|nr:phage tail protein [Escherichia coli]